MRAAGLKAVDTVVESSAILIQSHSPSNPELVSLVTARLKGVITAKRFVLCQYNIDRSNLAAANEIAPGKRSPSIIALDQGNLVAVSVMIEKKKMAVIMDELTKVGATDIFVTSIANTRS